jgi:glutamyl-Q tRNA(Asp) synthetase
MAPQGAPRKGEPRTVETQEADRGTTPAPRRFVCRFAPSPNGRLHLGHAYSALVNHDAARRMGGTYLVRMEDIDLTRCRPEFADAILDDLAFIGAPPDAPPRRQSAHMADYAAALARLEGMGLVYPAFESRAEIARAVAAQDATGARGCPMRRAPAGARQESPTCCGSTWRLRWRRRAVRSPGTRRRGCRRDRPLSWRRPPRPGAT